MPDEPRPDSPLENSNVRFEPRDASFRWIIGIVAGAIATLAIIHALVLVFFDRYRDHLAEVDRSSYPLATRPTFKPPREPRLEQIDRLSGDTESNIYVRQADKLRILDSCGSTESAGYVHIPIERAMQLLIAKDLLKARKEPAAGQTQRSEGLVDAGEPNSGRLLKGGTR